MLEAHCVGASTQVGTGPCGLPVEGGAGCNDGIQIDIVDVDIDRAEVGVFGKEQGELRACEGDLSRTSLSAGEVHGIAVGTGTGVGSPAAIEGPGKVGIIVGAWTDRRDLDSIDIDEGATPGMLETHGVGASPQIRAGPGGLPGQGGTGGDDCVQVDVVDENIDRAEV